MMVQWLALLLRSLKVLRLNLAAFLVGVCMFSPRSWVVMELHVFFVLLGLLPDALVSSLCPKTCTLGQLATLKSHRCEHDFEWLSGCLVLSPGYPCNNTVQSGFCHLGL